MEMSPVVANQIAAVNAPVNNELIHTRQGTIDKTELINLCIDELHTTNVFNVEPQTLFQLFDAVDHEESEDEVLDAYTNRILYPVRLQIVKTLFYYLYDEEMSSSLENMSHKALDLAVVAKERNMLHKTHEFTFPEEVTCTCDRAVSSKILLACDCCKSVLCQECSQAPCPVLIKDMIMKTDEQIMDCGCMPSFNDGDDEDSGDEVSIGYFLEHIFDSYDDDDESSEEDDEEMEIDYDDQDSDEVVD